MKTERTARTAKGSSPTSPATDHPVRPLGQGEAIAVVAPEAHGTATESVPAVGSVSEEDAMQITISTTQVAAVNADGYRGTWVALNASGKGRHLATVSGVDAMVQDLGVDMAVVGGRTWALRDVLSMAQRGEAGLVVVK